MRVRTHGRRPGGPLGIAGLTGIAGWCCAMLLAAALPARGAEPERPNLQGSWQLDPDLTARLSKDQQGQEGDPRAGGGKGDRHGPGLGSMGPIGGGGDHSAPGITDWSPARERHEAEVRREVVASLDSLTIVQQAGQVTITDQAGHARVLSLDPTHGRATGYEYITVAVGRDYADVAPLSGTYRAPFAGSLIATKRIFMTALGPGEGVDDTGRRAVA